MGRTEETITARRFFDGHSIHGPVRVTLSGGVVSSVEDHDGDCEHELLSPGLVDLQVNGWAGVDFASSDEDDLRRLDGELAALGTTSYLATLISDRLDRMSDRTALLAESSPLLPGMLGVHLEGPFLGRVTGAHRRDRVVPVDVRWLRTLPGNVRLVTLGAEQDGAAEAVDVLGSRGVTVSIGHSAPGVDDYERAVTAGARMVTHLFNAMSGVHHREFGLALAALTDRRVALGLIADMHHVSPRAVALAFAARPDAVCLVSDSVAWESPAFVRMGARIVNGAPRLVDGTLAGSSTSLAECVGRVVRECGTSLETVLRAATSVPAGLVGATEAGRIMTGRPCDIVAFDGDLCVRAVWRRLVSSRGNPTDD